jgi:phosphatidylglycerol lysyltransferase
LLVNGGRWVKTGRVSSDQTAARVLALLKRYGREATSFQVLEPGLCYWFDGDACLAYSEVRGAWVTAGEPLCELGKVREVTWRFVAAAQQAGRRVRFFHVSEAFCEQTGLRRTHIGEAPLWDPRDWRALVAEAKGLREQLRRARAKGVRARTVTAAEIGDVHGQLRLACEALVTRWLASRGMHELKFMVLVHPFSFAEERRYVVAERAGAVIGFGAAVPVYQKQGWFLEDLIRDASAPNGTTELLVHTMMEQLASEGCHYATLGLAPLAGDVSPLLAVTRRYTRRLYNFPGVRSFKEKLRPREWSPVYLAYPPGELGLVAMTDVLSAFAATGVLGFALDSLVHQRTLASLSLGLLLVPWTVGLSLADTRIWFPSSSIQWAWVAFDVVLIALMFSLVRKWRARVATWLAVLTSLDALLTTLQVLLWNVWTARTPLAWTLVLLGCAGPLLASLFFRRARLLAMGGGIRGHVPGRP